MASAEAWRELKYTLRRAYMSEVDQHVIRKDSQTYEDFWRFFRRYRSAIEAKGRSLFAPDPGLPERAGRLPVKIRLSKACRQILAEVPSATRQEFEFVLASFVAFRQRESFEKLRKLRKAQAELPIRCARDAILQHVREGQLLVVAGDTGCGKSTQVPQYLLAAGYEHVVVTQPRRLACVALASRVAQETLQEYGSRVAYQIRFERTRTLATRLLFMTEGLLLRQLAGDPELREHNVIVLDEVHERHLQGDFLLGLLKDLLPRRPDLKLLLMSATINIQQFQSYLPGAPLVQVPGRLHPVRLVYQPPPPKEKPQRGGEERLDPGPYLRVLQRIDAKHPPTERGDVLVFLPGITEIQTVADAVKEYAEHTRRWIVLMLHSTLSLEEQGRVFDVAPEGVRKVVLATNIAETSLTIDGIRFVIDSGKAKEMAYDAENMMQCLKERWISKASADQRKGRAGRTGPGTCYRLYAEAEFEAMEPFNMAEIRRVSLESLVLQMLSLGVRDPRTFDFIEPPSKEQLHEALESLADHGAVFPADNRLTPLGHLLVKLPVEVPIGKMLVLGCVFGQQETTLTLAAALTVQSPFTSSSYRDLDAINARQELMSSHGDPFTLLNVYREWLEMKGQREGTRAWCRRRGIEEQRLYEITKLRNQFRDLLSDADLLEKPSVEGDAHERLLRKGELRRLADLKRKSRNQQRQRKVLKLSSAGGAEASDDDEKSDVHALEFSMKHSDAELRGSLRRHGAELSSVSVLKTIMCGGLHPRCALLDRHNTYSQGADVLVHTRLKPFVYLHPNSTLGQDPGILGHQLSGLEGGHSPLHQLIYYSTLLETRKPYLLNSLRVPALHMALLTARNIHTSLDCGRIVLDFWLEFKSQDASGMQVLVFASARLRTELGRALEQALAGNPCPSRALARALTDFFASEVVYAVRQVHRVERASMFVGPGAQQASLPPSVLEAFGPPTPNPETGGLTLTPWLTYGSVVDEGQSRLETEHYLITRWTCPNCQAELHLNPVDRLEHLQSCNVQADDSSETPKKPGRAYFCEDCNRELTLTAVEILKHKRSHGTLSAT